MKTVLIIDEEEASRRLIKKVLAPDGWEVLEAKEGQAGLALATEHCPQLIICNLLVPGCNGFQLCRMLREKDELQSSTIIATSVRDYPSDRQGARDAGAQHFLVKPLDAMTLKDIVARYVLRHGVADLEPKETAISPDQPTRIKFWGVRGSIPSPGPETVRYGGNTSCVEVRTEGEHIILDAGSGIRPLGNALSKEFKGIPLNLSLLITHTHWDHIQGFPFFAPAYNPKNTIHVLGYEGARRSLQETLAGQMESPYFPINLKEMPGNILFKELRDLNFIVGKIRVQAMYVNHPGICVAYRLHTRDGSVTYMPDNENYQRLRSFPSDAGKDRTSESIEYARKQDQKMVEFIMHSDVLIIDSQYDEEEYKSHVGWGHSCADDSVNLAIRAGVKHVFLFHHDPAHDDDKLDAMAARARKTAEEQGSDLVVEAAREGLEIALRQTVRKRSVRRRND